MNCEFCHTKKASFRCPSCGTSLCKKHVEKRIGSLVFLSAFLAFFSVPIVSMLTKDIIFSRNNPSSVADLIGFFVGILIAILIAKVIIGNGCMKCHKDVRKL